MGIRLNLLAGLTLAVVGGSAVLHNAGYAEEKFEGESPMTTRAQMGNDQIRIHGKSGSESGGASTTNAASDSTEWREEPSGPAVPPGAGPVVDQHAWPDYSAMLPDCGVLEDVSCYDPETRESTYVWPPVDDDDATEEDDGVAPVVVTGAQVATAVREYARVQISPAPVIIQPEQDWHLVNLPVIVRTEPNVQEFSTELLGLPVDIRAEPVSYSWDFGDGSPVLNTADVGAPYPDQTIEHAYTEAGEYQITMVAYWSGSFRVGGGPWIDIDGLGVTSSTTPVLDLQTRTTRLVG